ncbi:MAG: hypothetical protein BMS9Abin29_1576 [Gemmatimonadota bacterium]|nr:MAG: hypothetical protein BMS9Abin29_1576 [Gemmatimonadota bacterium]
MSGGGVETAGDLAPEAREGLRRLVIALADAKRLMGLRYSDWLLGAPSIETGIAASSMAQDEWGHARLLYAMLKSFDMDPVRVEHERASDEYCSPDALDRPFGDWADVVAGGVVIDGAISTCLRSFAAGSYEPARSRVPKMLAEEEFHWDMAGAWYHRLANASDEARARLRDSTLEMLPSTLAWMAPDDAAAKVLSDAGLADAPGAIRSSFEAVVGPVVAELEIDLSTAESRSEGWDESRGRGPGGPDDEAIERARGDRNRMLFVE